MHTTWCEIYRDNDTENQKNKICSLDLMDVRVLNMVSL
jgi:hypothetical protein